jgi:hypothetical protein
MVSRKKRPKIEVLRQDLVSAMKESSAGIVADGVEGIKEAMKEFIASTKITSAFDGSEEEVYDAVDKYIAEFIKDSQAYFAFDDDSLAIHLVLGALHDIPFIHKMKLDTLDDLGDPYEEYGGAKSDEQLNDLRNRVSELDIFIANLSAKRDELRGAVDEAEKRLLRRTG